MFTILYPESREEYMLAALERVKAFAWRFARDNELDIDDVLQDAAVIIAENVDRAINLCLASVRDYEHIGMFYNYIKKAVERRLINSVVRQYSVRPAASLDNIIYGHHENSDAITLADLIPAPAAPGETDSARQAREEAVHAAIAQLPVDEQQAIIAVAQLTGLVASGAAVAVQRHPLTIRRAAYRHLYRNRDLAELVGADIWRDGRARRWDDKAVAL